MPRIVLTGFLICRSLEEADRVAALLPAHTEATLSEPGCVGFEVWRSMADPVRFAVKEVFRDRESFEAHRARLEASDWWRVTKDIPRDYRVTVSAL
jgi:quinol monooxygenase YgiN